MIYVSAKYKACILFVFHCRSHHFEHHCISILDNRDAVVHALACFAPLCGSDVGIRG